MVRGFLLGRGREWERKKLGDCAVRCVRNPTWQSPQNHTSTINYANYVPFAYIGQTKYENFRNNKIIKNLKTTFTNSLSPLSYNLIHRVCRFYRVTVKIAD